MQVNDFGDSRGEHFWGARDGVWIPNGLHPHVPIGDSSLIRWAAKQQRLLTYICGVAEGEIFWGLSPGEVFWGIPRSGS